MKFVTALWAVIAITSPATAQESAPGEIIDMGLVTEDGRVITDKAEEEAYKKSWAPKPSPPKFLPQIIGKPKAAVDKVLGKPDDACIKKTHVSASKKIVGLECLYQSGKVEIVYFNKKADWIAFNNPENSDFNSLTLLTMGLSCPSVVEARLIEEDGFQWQEACDGMISVSMWPGAPGPGDYKVVRRIEIKTATP